MISEAIRSKQFPECYFVCLCKECSHWEYFSFFFFLSNSQHLAVCADWCFYVAMAKCVCIFDFVKLFTVHFLAVLTKCILIVWASNIKWTVSPIIFKYESNDNKIAYLLLVCMCECCCLTRIHGSAKFRAKKKKKKTADQSTK